MNRTDNFSKTFGQGFERQTLTHVSAAESQTSAEQNSLSLFSKLRRHQSFGRASWGALTFQQGHGGQTMAPLTRF